MPDPCPFCSPDPAQLIEQGELALALLDAYPVSPGHTLIIPRRHVARLSETTPEERAELFDLQGVPVPREAYVQKTRWVRQIVTEGCLRTQWHQVRD